MKKPALVAPVAALALVSCAHNPTIAATVAGRTIPVSDVSIMASFLCASISGQSGAQAVPMSQVNEIATTYLVGAKSLADLAGRSGVKVPPAASPAADRLVASLPASQRARATTIVNEVDSALNFVAQQVGATSSQQVLSTLASVIGTQTKAGRVTGNPAYPTLATGGSGSLSTPVSTIAAAAVSAQPTTDYVAALPTGQRCG